MQIFLSYIHCNSLWETNKTGEVFVICKLVLFLYIGFQDDDFYTAAVVEYNFGTAANSVDSYINIIQSLDEVNGTKL